MWLCVDLCELVVALARARSDAQKEAKETVVAFRWPEKGLCSVPNRVARETPATAGRRE